MKTGRMASTVLAMLLLATAASSADKKRGDPTKDRPRRTIEAVHRKILQALSSGESIKAELELPVHQLHYLPEIPRPRFAGLVLSGGTTPLVISGGSIPGTWGFKGKKPGHANIILKFTHPQQPATISRIALKVIFKEPKTSP